MPILPILQFSQNSATASADINSAADINAAASDSPAPTHSLDQGFFKYSKISPDLSIK